MAIYLVATKENGESISILMHGRVTVGRRNPSSYIFPDDDRMSGHHGTFQVSSGGELIYIDAESSNGSRLNGQKVLEARLRIGDILKLGHTSFSIDATRLTAYERERIENAESKLTTTTVPLELEKKKRFRG